MSKRKERIPIVCLQCGKIRYVTPYVAKTAKFCCRKCCDEYGCTEETIKKIKKNTKLAMTRPEVKAKTSGKNHYAWHEKVPVTCAWCKTIKYVTPYVAETKKYCSVECTCAAGQSEMACIKISKRSAGKNSASFIQNPTSIQLFNRNKRVCHIYINIMNGFARYYLCVDCGKQAHHWSNINNHVYHKCSDEYVPRCTRCHKLYDIQLSKNKLNNV